MTIPFRTIFSDTGRPDYRWTLSALLCTNCIGFINDPDVESLAPIPLMERCKCSVEVQLEIIDRHRKAYG